MSEDYVPAIRFTLTKPDGTDVDVTEAVQIIYDALVQSMDFGSGMLDTEELQALFGLASSAGFQLPCLACIYYSNPWEPAPDCAKTKRPGGHCNKCADIERLKASGEWGNSSVHTEYVSRYSHWVLCPNKEAESA